jgi:drug/metabolite transporter (DMT)-like permease
MELESGRERRAMAATTAGPRAVRWIWSGEASILGAAAVYGLSTTLSVIALHSVRPVDLAAVELCGASVVLLAVAAATGRLTQRGALRQLLLGGLDPGLAFLLADLGLARTSASAGSLLIAADPLLSVLLAVVFLAERLSVRGTVALTVGLSGSALIALKTADRNASGSATIGNLLVLAGVASAAVFLVAARRFSNDMDSLSASAWQVTGGALITAPFVAWSWHAHGSRLGLANTTGWTTCLVVLLCGALGAAAFNRGIGKVSATRAGQLLNLTPVVGLLTAAALLGERPSAWQLIGGGFTFVGLALVLPAKTSPVDDDDSVREPPTPGPDPVCAENRVIW